MPVITRSCGRKEVRSRIEDPTPRRLCQTTMKRKKDFFDEEEAEKPVRKKPNTTVKETAITQSNKNADNLKSKIPRRIAYDKPQKEHLNSGRGSTESSPYEISSLTPVAARTRSFSALKKSYQGKKYKKNDGKNNKTLSLQNETVINGPIDKNKTPETQDHPCQVRDIDSLTCKNADDIEMKDSLDNSTDGNNDERFYKKKFHELLEHVRNMQECFNTAQNNASKNIKAYDAFIKELKESLEKERAKTIAVEDANKKLQNTNNQLIETQKELEQAAAQFKGPSPVKTTDGNFQKVENNSRLHSMIAFYEMLCGISLSSDGESPNTFESYHCVYKPKGFEGKAMQFKLIYDKEVEEVQFSPMVLGNDEFVTKMPKFLREDIYFDIDQVPSFLSKIIQSHKNLH